MVSNTGGSDLSLIQYSVVAQGFTVAGLSLPMKIGAGKQVMMNVLFSPKGLGGTSSAVSVMSNAANSPATVSVSGTGVSATPLLNPSSSSLSFGDVALGGSSILGITITDAGNSKVSISKVKISGAGFAATGVSAGMILAPGQNATLDVVFAPTAEGSSGGNITLASDATNSPAVISLSGSGAQASSHAAILTWTASEAPAAGYNVYRSTVSGGPYARLNLSTVVTTSYADSAVLYRQVYYYVVTTVADGMESADSNQAAAAIPDS